MILVTGATGTVGRLVVERLPNTLPVRILTRNPHRAVALSGPQTDIVGGDFEDPSSLRRALAGVTTALLVTVDPLTPTHDTNFLAAARAAGVRHVVKLSAEAVSDPGATDLITEWQRENERQLRASRLSWTLLRPRAFMTNTLGWARSIRADGVVRVVHGAAPNATIDPRDIADVAALVLAEPEAHSQRTYALTGPTALTAAEQTEILADLLNRPLLFEDMSDTQAACLLLERYPARVAQALLESGARGILGTKSDIHPTVSKLLGRPARSYRTWAVDHLESFRMQ
ncbi:NAD(P)H-binding protein [Streptomyces sp. NPDC058417]|uniref:NAD(P)H-binding protein n=1 Tax=unclassified Streptomyces TaxID=2593676 RepID=UPI0036636EE0